MTELRLLEYFVTVADELSFTRAAERLHVTPPTISVGIKTLERRLAVRLFDRTSRSVTLTSAGLQLLDEARRDLTSAADFDDAARSLAERVELVAGTFWGLGADRLSAAARAVAATGWDVALDLRVYGWDDPTGGLRQRDVDMAIVPGPSDIDDQLHRLPLWQETRVAILPTSSPLADRPNVTLADLDALGWVRFPEVDPIAHPYWRLDHVRGGAPVERGRVHHTPHELMLAIRAGVGTCTTLESFRDQFSFEGLALVPIADVPPVNVDLAHRLDHHPEGLDRIIDAMPSPEPTT